MRMDPRERAEQDARLMLAVFYEGPWAKLSNWCYGLKKDGTLLWEIDFDSTGIKGLLGKLGDHFEQKDRDWQARHIIAGKSPNPLWRRKP